MKQAKGVFESFKLKFEIDTTGKQQATSLRTVLNGELELFRKSDNSGPIGQSLESHILFKVNSISCSVMSDQDQSLDVSGLNERFILISPPLSDGNNVEIKYTGDKLSTEELNALRLIAQNIHSIVAQPTSDIDDTFKVTRKDLYGQVDWNWQKKIRNNNVATYGFYQKTTDVVTVMENWVRDMVWDYELHENQLSLRGSEKIELFMNKQKILTIDVYASFAGDKTSNNLSEKEILDQLSVLSNEMLVVGTDRSSLETTTNLSFSDIRKSLLSADPGPTFYNEVAKVLSIEDVDDSGILNLLSRLRINSSSYKAMVLGLAFSQGEHKKFLLNHLSKISPKQKLDLIPILAQGPVTDISIVEYLGHMATKTEDRNLKSAAALTLGTTYHRLNSDDMRGVGPDEVFSIIENGLSGSKSANETAIWLSALGNTGEARVVNIVSKYTKHNQANVREKAFFALRNVLGEENSSRALEVAKLGLSDSSDRVRKRAAMSALSIIGGANLKSEILSELGIEIERLNAIENSAMVRSVLSKITKRINEKCNTYLF